MASQPPPTGKSALQIIMTKLLIYHVQLAQHYTRLYESTLVHGLTKLIKFEDGKFRDAHDDPLRLWEETNLYSVLVSVDAEEMYDLLTTRDEHGDTPIHKLRQGRFCHSSSTCS